MQYNNSLFGNWFRILVSSPYNSTGNDSRVVPPILDYWTDDALNIFYDDNGDPFEVEILPPYSYWTDDSGSVFLDDSGDPFIL